MYSNSSQLTAIEEFGQFAYHCRFGHLNSNLRDYLHSLDAPYDKCIETTSVNGSFPSYETWKLMFSFFSTMNREVREGQFLSHVCRVNIPHEGL
jgi:hypothetical protein